MGPRYSQWARWGLLCAGLLAVGLQVDRVWPRENVLLLAIPAGTTAQVELEVADEAGDILRQVRIPKTSGQTRISYALAVPRGDYRVSLTCELASSRDVDKNHDNTWTRVGGVHQIRLEGGTYHLRPPTEAP